MLKFEFYETIDELNDLVDKRDDCKDNDVENTVNKIIEDIRIKKDEALLRYTKELDGVELSEGMLIEKDEIENIANIVSKEIFKALELAKNNIEKFHKKQIQESYITFEKNGVYIGQKVVPIEKVGVYVPGGTAAYPSSVLMNVIPAKIAGVKEIIMVTPPYKNGKINPIIAAAAIIAGVDKIFTIGGAQAIAALAYGTETVDKVDKIVGPGNVYVATAKKKLYGKVDIDMIAGPSEILIIADKRANPKFIAADLLSQAEHDKLAASILVTTSKDIYNKVNIEIEKQIENLERKDIASESIKNFGRAIICPNIDLAIEIANELAPEHLELMIENPMKYLGKIKNAGSIFLGDNTPEAIGDYFAGVNHVLPTNRTARFFSGLSVDSFTKKISYTYYTKEAIEENGHNIVLLANEEGLTAHGNSIKIRIEENKNE
ncbi:MAG: histidinol dehydrogenase [Sarcina sp.]